MSTRNWTRGGVGFVAAIMATISVTACDPYLAANKDAPVVLGVTMVDLNYNTDFNFVLPGDSPGCTSPYPQPDQAWADRVFPGLCVAGGPTTVCPVLCYPPRTGPGYAPFFTGNLGGTYQTAGGTPYTFEVASTYTLNAVPPTYIDPDGSEFIYGQIRILFNKLMDPASIQPDPNVSAPPSTLRIFEGTVDVTSQFAFEYVPNSDTTYWGASIAITPLETATLANDTTYRVVGVVKDQQGASLNVGVTINTGPDIDATPPAAARAK